MPSIRLGIPNNPSFKYSLINGLLAALFLAAAALIVTTVVRHLAYFRLHYLLWSVLGLALLVACLGCALIFFDEALLREKGHLRLTDDGFEIGDDMFLLNMIRKVAVVVMGYRGQRLAQAQTATGRGNRFVFYTEQQQTIACEFLLNSKGELEILEKILLIWRRRGVRLVTEGIELESGQG